MNITENIINISNGIHHTDDRYGTVIALDIPGAAPLHKLDVAYAVIRPGAKSPAHFHERTEEVYAIVKGEGTMTIDGITTPVTPGDIVRIPIFAVHAITAGVDGLEFWVSTSPPYTVNDDFETDAIKVDGPTVDTPTKKITIAVITGTHRKGSVSTKVSKQVCEMYRALGVGTDLIDLAELPADFFSPASYDHRYETDSALSQRIIRANGLHLCTPEYNGSFPGILKHMLDVQPYKECFDQKMICLTGVAAGQWGGLRAVEQLQQVFSYRNAFIFPQRVFIREIEDVSFDNGHRIIDPEIVDRLERQTKGFIEFVRCLNPLRLT